MLQAEEEDKEGRIKHIQIESETEIKRHKDYSPSTIAKMKGEQSEPREIDPNNFLRSPLR